MKSDARLAVVGSSLSSNLPMKNKVAVDTMDSFEEQFGVTKNELKNVLTLAKSRGGDFSELYFQYKISNSINMEEGIIKETAESISVGVGIRVLVGEKTGYGYTNDLSFEAMKNAALTGKQRGGKFSGCAPEPTSVGFKSFDVGN